MERLFAEVFLRVGADRYQLWRGLGRLLVYVLTHAAEQAVEFLDRLEQVGPLVQHHAMPNRIGYLARNYAPI